MITHIWFHFFISCYSLSLIHSKLHFVLYVTIQFEFHPSSYVFSLTLHHLNIFYTVHLLFFLITDFMPNSVANSCNFSFVFAVGVVSSEKKTIETLFIANQLQSSTMKFFSDLSHYTFYILVKQLRRHHTLMSKAYFHWKAQFISYSKTSLMTLPL